jgi:S-adenosylmethionine:tRNA ribosyltransferase-isomerase
LSFRSEAEESAFALAFAVVFVCHSERSEESPHFADRRNALHHCQKRSKLKTVPLSNSNSMLVSDFHFDLPESLIAQHPPAERGSSRMLVLHRAPQPNEPALVDERFTSLPDHLQPGDLLVLNDSRVLPARLFATRRGARTQANSPDPSGQIEVLLTEQLENSAHPEENLWHALVRPARKVQPGETLLFFEPHAEAGRSAQPVLTAEIVATGEFGERTLRFAPTEDFYATIACIGHMPLPPYIHRDQAEQPDSAEDRERYQTVYSQQLGSAAAPTAGLHFTPQVLAALQARGVKIATITLHVGLGTFQPVRVERLDQIRLHSERYTLPESTAAAINRARAEGRRVIAAGTTTTRTLEHIASEAERAGETSLRAHSGATSIFIAPGHRFRIVGGLLTNFHLPESTLLMLVAAFVATPFAAKPNCSAPSQTTPTQTANDRAEQGRQKILAAYAHAVRAQYRFYSYGDCMLLL